MDSHGKLIWAKSTEGQAYDFKVQEYKGEQFLTYWQGDDKVRGHGAGDFYMVYCLTPSIDIIADDISSILVTKRYTKSQLSTVWQPTSTNSLSRLRVQHYLLSMMSTNAT